MRSVLLVLLALVAAGCVAPAPVPAHPDDPVVREFHVEAVEREIELHPGKRATLWTFDGQVPGPLLRATEGDLVRVHFWNNHTLPHTLHFHGAHPFAMDGDDGQPVAPGASFTYAFVAGPPGAYVYHCHVDTPVHIPMGLYGQFVVDPKEGWPGGPVDRELFAVFSDWNPRHNATAEAYLLNGKAFPATEPFQVRVGDRVRLFVTSMSDVPVAAHLHGYVPRQVWPAEHPIDVVPLAHAESRVLTFTAEAPGAWMFHDHFEQHLANDGVYPGGSLTAIEVGEAFHDEFHKLMGPHAPPHPAPPADHADDPPTDGAAPPDGPVVAVEDYRFAPAVLTVRPGETVTWTHVGGAAHTVTSTDGGPLDSGILRAGASYRHTFREPGTYEYRCLPHSAQAQDGSWSGMVGRIVVAA